MSTSPLLLFTLFVFLICAYMTVATSPALITSETGAQKVNVHFTHSTENNSSLTEPHPDVTILSAKYFLCVWSYSFKQLIDENLNKSTYSNEIFANLFSTSENRNMIKKEFELNEIRGYSQDSPSLTTLFNATAHAFDRVIVVWESQITFINGTAIDAIYGRIIKWTINTNDGIRYISITSPTPREFRISQSNTLHHSNPDVIPIYGTEKFMVTWISTNIATNENMIFIRIYTNNGKSTGAQIQVFENELTWKKYPKIVPLLHNFTLLTYTSQIDNNEVGIYGIIFDEFGNKILDDKYRFVSMGNVFLSGDDTMSMIAHLYSDYFIVGWLNAAKTRILCAVYRYNDIDKSIEKLSDNKVVQNANLMHIIENPSMHNIMDETYLLDDGLDAQIALCWSSKSTEEMLIFSNVFCKILEITLWNDVNDIYASIDIITETVMINENITYYHQHSYPRISSNAILRDRSFDNEDPKFYVVWSNKKSDDDSGNNHGYDVYTKILSVQSNPDYIGGNVTEIGSEHKDVELENLNAIIIGVVFGVILVIILICVLNHYYIKYKKTVRPKVKMQQIGEESDDDEHDQDEDYGHYNTDKVQLTDQTTLG